MSQTVTGMAGAALRVYDKVVHEQVFTKNVLFMNILSNVAHDTGAASLASNTNSKGGGGKMITVHYGRNTGSAAGGEGMTLPTAGSQAYLQANIEMKYNFHQISLTDVVLQASKRSKEFLVNVLESEYDGAKNDMQRQLSRQGYGVGTGVICRVNDASPDTTLTFDAPMVGKNPMDYFDVGNGLMFSSAADAATSAAYTEVAAITGNDTMTVASGTGVADNDYVYLAHDNGTASPTVSNVNAEIMGLKGLIDDGTNLTTLEGLSRSTYIWWKSYVNDNSGTTRSLTEALLHDTYLEAKKKGDPKYILTSFDVQSAYGQLYSGDRRYTNADMKLNGGFTGVDFNGLPLVADYDCPYTDAFFVDPSTLSIEDLAPISFLNEDGAILDRSATTPAWNATLRYYANLANSAPNKSTRLSDIVK